MILKIIISVLIIISLHQSIIAQCNEQQHAGEALPLWLYQDANELATNNTRSAKLHELLALRVGPNIQASSDYHDFQDIHLNESLEAWHEWHERARHYAHHQVNAIRPHLIQLLTDSNVSASCTQAALTFLNAAQQMDEWAIQSKYLEKNLSHVTQVQDQYLETNKIKIKINSVELVRKSAACRPTRRPLHRLGLLSRLYRCYHFHHFRFASTPSQLLSRWFSASCALACAFSSNL